MEAQPLRDNPGARARAASSQDGEGAEVRNSHPQPLPLTFQTEHMGFVACRQGHLEATPWWPFLHPEGHSSLTLSAPSPSLPLTSQSQTPPPTLAFSSDCLPLGSLQEPPLLSLHVGAGSPSAGLCGAW